MRSTTRIAAAALVSLALAAGGASAAYAGHDRNPSAKVASYGYELDAIQPAEVPESRASGTTRVKALPNGKLQVIVEAWGLSPNLPHAMHLHGVPGDAADMGCPGPAQAGQDGKPYNLDKVYLS